MLICLSRNASTHWYADEESPFKESLRRGHIDLEAAAPGLSGSWESLSVQVLEPLSESLQFYDLLLFCP